MPPPRAPCQDICYATLHNFLVAAVRSTRPKGVPATYAGNEKVAPAAADSSWNVGRKSHGMDVSSPPHVRISAAN